MILHTSAKTDSPSLPIISNLPMHPCSNAATTLEDKANSPQWTHLIPQFSWDKGTCGIVTGHLRRLGGRSTLRPLPSCPQRRKECELFIGRKLWNQIREYFSKIHNGETHKKDIKYTDVKRSNVEYHDVGSKYAPA